MNPQKNIIPNFEWFHHNFNLAFLNKELQIKKQLNTRLYKGAEEKVSSRVLNHWQEIGIISENREGGKGWRKFSISELVWISLVSKLRKFGLDLGKIKMVREYLDTYNSTEDQSDCPLLDFYITYALSTETPINLLVFESGQALFASQKDVALSKQVGLIYEDFISLDLSKLVSQIFIEKKVKTNYLDFSASPIEKEVKNSLMAENIKSLLIRDIKGNEYHVEKEIVFNSSKEMNSMLRKLKYAQSQTIKIDGRQVYILTEKSRVKKK